MTALTWSSFDGALERADRFSRRGMVVVDHDLDLAAIDAALGVDFFRRHLGGLRIDEPATDWASAMILILIGAFDCAWPGVASASATIAALAESIADAVRLKDLLIVTTSLKLQSSLSG